MDRHEREQFYNTRYRVGEQDVQGQLRHQEAQQLLQESLDQTQQESQESAEPQRREVAPQRRPRQAYPDEGWAHRPVDYTPLRNAGIGLAVLLTVGWFGIQAALSRLNSDSPSNEPKPVPTATLTPGEVLSLRIYNELIQAEKTHPAEYADSFNVLVDGANVRNLPSAARGDITGQLNKGDHITEPNLLIMGDNPDTGEVEDEKNAKAVPWLAFTCPQRSPTNLPKDKLCFTHGENIKQVK